MPVEPIQIEDSAYITFEIKGSPPQPPLELDVFRCNNAIIALQRQYWKDCPTRGEGETLEYIVPSEVTAALNDAIHELMLGWGFTRLSHGTMFKVQKSLAERADELQKKENPARSNSGSPS